MSALSGIVTDVEKFFKATGSDAEKFATEFVKLFKKSPSALQAIQNFITGEVAPVLIAAVALADPAVEPEVAAALATVETMLAGLQAAATAAVSGTSVLTSLQNFAATMPNLFVGLAIKNPALQARITAIVNLAVNEGKVLIPAVEAWVKQIATKPVSA
jgi:hypothetical protein